MTMGPLTTPSHTPLPNGPLAQTVRRTPARPLPLGHGGPFGDPWQKSGVLPVAVEWTEEITGPRKPAPTTPASAPAQPARLPWSDPTRAAARVAARAKRAERLKMYLSQGLTSVAAEERANRDAYQEITRG